MARSKFSTLTEQMYYVLLCLKDECCGMEIMDKVSSLTNGRVQVGSGTLYNLLEQFLDYKMIKETKAEGRRRSYIITEEGCEALRKENERLMMQIKDFNQIFKDK